MTWCKITRQLLRYKPGLLSDYFRRKETRLVEESQLSYLTRKKKTLFVKCSKILKGWSQLRIRIRQALAFYGRFRII